MIVAHKLFMVSIDVDSLLFTSTLLNKYINICIEDWLTNSIYYKKLSQDNLDCLFDFVTLKAFIFG